MKNFSGLSSSSSREAARWQSLLRPPPARLLARDKTQENAVEYFPSPSLATSLFPFLLSSHALCRPPPATRPAAATRRPRPRRGDPRLRLDLLYHLPKSREPGGPGTPGPGSSSPSPAAGRRPDSPPAGHPSLRRPYQRAPGELLVLRDPLALFLSPRRPPPSAAKRRRRTCSGDQNRAAPPLGGRPCRPAPNAPTRVPPLAPRRRSRGQLGSSSIHDISK